MKWNKCVVQGTPPSIRGAHSASLVENDIYVFGGYEGNTHMSDVHVLDAGNNNFQIRQCSWATPAENTFFVSVRPMCSRAKFPIYSNNEMDQTRSQTVLPES